jgi:uncharacterized membrane protein
LEFKQRYRSIDILRGLAIILMVQVHFVDNLSSSEGPSAWLYTASTYLGSIPAPFFAFVSGLSYALWLRKQQSLQRRDEEITKITLRRGLFLFGIGIAFNFFIWLPDETFNWDILTLLGTSLLVLAFARKLPSSVLTLICLLVVLFSPLLRVVGHCSDYWNDEAYNYDDNFRDILFGFISNGYFPVFPWIIFPITGFVCGGQIFQKSSAAHSTPWRLCLFGFALLVVSVLGTTLGARLRKVIARHYADGISEFPASTDYVIAMLGLALISAVLLHRWVDQRADVGDDGRLMTVLRRFSVFSLTVYVLHHAVILWPLWIYGVWKGHADPKYYWRHAMSTPMALALTAVFLVACYLFLIVLERNKKFSLEWMMRWICE